MLIASKSDVAIANIGMIRTNWPKGDLTLYRIFETIPFDNQLLSFDMTGEELFKTIDTLQSGSKGVYATAGIKQYLKAGSRRLIEITFMNGTEILPDKIYKVCAPDFLLKGGDDFRKTKAFYNPRNIQNHGNLRERMIEYITALGRLNTKAKPF